MHILKSFIILTLAIALVIIPAAAVTDLNETNFYSIGTHDFMTRFSSPWTTNFTTWFTTPVMHPLTKPGESGVVKTDAGYVSGTQSERALGLPRYPIRGPPDRRPAVETAGAGTTLGRREGNEGVMSGLPPAGECESWKTRRT